ncbi:hypothetical protein N2603_06780 [Bradyrhizobium huanghuaihaiense]|uniref:hypothetical protein n=1 Tax=Bradyrhizobium huanghuaihaiense TaxID=990078 RepID=UPI0021A99425|nr:hypothetical protein [Bradyrhizobium sp. CB3035]UWU78159.1 hypothetical protein N2603_06780 [Bradyrhizobium sp. CB3035]
MAPKDREEGFRKPQENTRIIKEERERPGHGLEERKEQKEHERGRRGRDDSSNDK